MERCLFSGIRAAFRENLEVQTFGLVWSPGLTGTGLGTPCYMLVYLLQYPHIVLFMNIVDPSKSRTGMLCCRSRKEPA